MCIVGRRDTLSRMSRRVSLHPFTCSSNPSLLLIWLTYPTDMTCQPSVDAHSVQSLPYCHTLLLYIWLLSFKILSVEFCFIRLQILSSVFHTLLHDRSTLAYTRIYIYGYPEGRLISSASYHACSYSVAEPQSFISYFKSHKIEQSGCFERAREGILLQFWNPWNEPWSEKFTLPN